MTDGFAYEKQAAIHGYTAICGIDEAGRGPLAGPVFAAAVILPEGLVIEVLESGLPQSRKLMNSIFCRQPTWQCGELVKS